MLVLSRKRYQTIQIDDHTTITVLAIQGGRVKLGIKAPKGVIVHRGEVRRAIQGGEPA